MIRKAEKEDISRIAEILRLWKGPASAGSFFILAIDNCPTILYNKVTER